jgi:ribosomal protein S18 acetylase RimI-like enzyme
MNFVIELGTDKDIDELEQLYNDTNDYLASTVNYPGWLKGVYPVRENAVNGVNNQTLYVAKSEGTIVGTVILSHEQEPVYHNVTWKVNVEEEKILVIYTFVVHPNYLKNGVGKALLDFACELGKSQQVETLRLDVYEKNLPAIKLYEKCGFEYIDTVDLGYSQYGLDWFKLYEKLI